MRISWPFLNPYHVLFDKHGKERHAFWGMSSELHGFICSWIFVVYTVNLGKLTWLISLRPVAGPAFLFEVLLICWTDAMIFGITLGCLTSQAERVAALKGKEALKNIWRSLILTLIRVFTSNTTSSKCIILDYGRRRRTNPFVPSLGKTQAKAEI